MADSKFDHSLFCYSSSVLYLKNNYGLKRSDFYQLFAYGSICLRGRDDAKLVLIYPMRAAFDEPLQVFKFSETLELWVLPFDLDAGNLGHLASTNLPLLTKKM